MSHTRARATDAARHREARQTRVAGLALVAAVFAAALLLRLATASFVNDDYLHLSIAQQIVLGDVPVRDFIDPGEFLFNYTSAGAQLLFGRNVLSEVLLDAFFLSLGHTLVFVLASRASQSRVLGLLAAGMSVVLVTRLYSYPKIVLYGLALLVMWRYADDRRRRTLMGAALATAVAFLFRHDHGASIGAATVAMLLLAHWQDGWRRVQDAILLYGAATASLLLPFFVFLQVTGAGLGYWRNMIETGRAEYERTVGAFPRFDVELAGVVPTLEATPTNAVAWLYYLTVLLPALTLLVVTLDVYRRRHGVRVLARPAMANEAQKMTAAAVLAVLMHMFLLRAASESAIADVSTATAVLGAWLLARGLIPAAGLVRGAWRASANASRPAARRVAVALIQAVVAVAIAGLTLRYLTQTEGGDAVRTFAAELRDDGEEGAPAFRRLDEFRRMSPPFEDEGARYVFACTSEADRLLVVSEYAPHAPYAAGRGFAAGRLYFLSSFAPSAEYHAFSLERLREERVPIVLVNRPDREGFARGFSALHQYLLEHYREAGEAEFDETPLTVLVDARIAPVGTYGPRALPCFRAAAGAAESHDAAD